MRHSTLPALLLLVASATLATPAVAGGLGLIGTSGLHQTRLFYYDVDGDQYRNLQVRPNNGGGIEVVLGDKDDKLLGLARGFFMVDAAPETPTDPSGDPPITVAVPEGPLYVGLTTVGVHWGVLGDPTRFQAHIASNLGAAIVTLDSTTGEGANLEYVLGEVGVGAHYHFARKFQVYADAVFALRYRKSFSPGGSGYLGVRYMFD